MRSIVAALLFAACLAQAQVAPVRENYSKYEYRIPMRDGIRLFVSVYVPKDVFTESKTYPIMMMRIIRRPSSDPNRCRQTGCRGSPA